MRPRTWTKAQEEQLAADVLSDLEAEFGPMLDDEDNPRRRTVEEILEESDRDARARERGVSAPSGPVFSRDVLEASLRRHGR